MDTTSRALITTMSANIVGGGVNGVGRDVHLFISNVR